MKTLYVMRHAKSSWADPLLPDFDRPLNERGKADAPEMGKRLKKKGIHPDLIISSPARRAFKTAQKVAKAIDYPKNKILTDKMLYLAGASAILAVVKETADTVNSLMIFGHNPGWTDFVNEMTGSHIDNIPTAGIAAIQFDVNSWEDIGKNKGKLLLFDYPKREE